MNPTQYAQEFIRAQMAKDAPLFIRAICGGKGLQMFMNWAFSIMVARNEIPPLEGLEPEYKKELWEAAKDAVHNSGHEFTRELGISMCKTIIVIQMLK